MLEVSSLTRYTSPKIISLEEAAKRIKKFKKEGKTVGVCHGGYDLLHPGHITHFESAKKACDILFVSVTSDRFVAGRKGIGRPIFPDTLRAYMIANIGFIDFVTITDYKSGIDVINILKPSFYIKGPDFIGKQTPGITAEREAITAIGGKMVYTKDPKLSTTEIIDYIKKNIMDVSLLLVIDRDGTLITNDDFIGKNKNWKIDIKLNTDVASFLYYLKTKYHVTNLVATNQTGVARGFFPEKIVQEINTSIAELLAPFNVKIDNWQYCPYADALYAKAHREYKIKKHYIQAKTKRKPAPDMVLDGLKELHKDLGDFTHIVVLGDRDEDRELAINLKAVFLDAKSKSYQELLSEFIGLTKLA